jgi:hypothetical protein
MHSGKVKVTFNHIDITKYFGDELMLRQITAPPPEPLPPGTTFNPADGSLSFTIDFSLCSRQVCRLRHQPTQYRRKRGHPVHRIT